MYVVRMSVDPAATAQHWSTWFSPTLRRRLGFGPMDVKVLAVRAPSYSEVAGVWPESGWCQHLVTPSVMGPVPTMSWLLRQQGEWGHRPLSAADQVAFLHDDLALYTDDWWWQVMEAFAGRKEMGLLGFSGCTGVGPDTLPDAYDPTVFARRGFYSNLTDAEVHGARRMEPCRSAACDGFSLVFRGDYLELWMRFMRAAGIVHHLYDTLAGVIANHLKYEVWYLPVPCYHAGGQTTVKSPEYAALARELAGNDLGIWEQAHKAGWDMFRHMLPIRVEGANR